jgi:hypothetical protein
VNNPDASKRNTFTFGAGRRIYAGMHVAERSLFLGISSLDPKTKQWIEVPKGMALPSL